MTKFLFFILIVLFIFMSCSEGNNKKLNFKSGEDLVNNFYSNCRNNLFVKNNQYFSSGFKKGTNNDQLNKTINILDSLGGKINSIEIVDSLIRYDDKYKSILLLYKVKRDSFFTREEFTIIQERDSLKILRYDVQKIMNNEEILDIFKNIK